MSAYYRSWNESTVTVHQTLVWPYQVHCVQGWNPFLKKRESFQKMCKDEQKDGQWMP